MTNKYKLTFLGDVMCEFEQLEGHRTEENSYNFDEIFYNTKNYFKSSDYVVANLETPLAGKELGYSSEKWSFNTPKEFGEALKNSGVDLVSTANNHCLDRGIAGLKNTIEELEEIGLKYVGTHKNKKDKNYFIKDVGGIKICFFSYTYGTNAFANKNYLKKDEKYMVNLFQEQELNNWVTRKFLNSPSRFFSKVYIKLARTFYPSQFKKPIYERKESNRRFKKEFINDLKNCKKDGAEYIVMLMHAGGQYNNDPTKQTIKLADFLVENGVNAIIGTHEHVIHHYEKKKNVTFSLGNFTGISGVFKEPFDKMSDYSIVFNIYLSKENTEVKVEKTTFSITKSIPCGDNKVQTVFLYDLIKNSKNSDVRDKLMHDNLKIVNKFTKKQLDMIENQKEYIL